MKTISKVVFLGIGLAFFHNCAQQKTSNATATQLYLALSQKRVQLPNQWALTPVGRSLPLGDLPFLRAKVCGSHQ
jgi:hypothetical protein